MHNDSMLEVSETTLIPKLLMAFEIPWYRFFGFSKTSWFLFFNDNRNSTNKM